MVQEATKGMSFEELCSLGTIVIKAPNCIDILGEEGGHQRVILVASTERRWGFYLSIRLSSRRVALAWGPRFGWLYWNLA